MRLTLALGIAFMLGMAARAEAAEQITVSGCAHETPPMCTIISSGGQTYALISDKPIPTNVGITVTGVKAGDLGICFATPLKVVKWSPNKMACPSK